MSPSRRRTTLPVAARHRGAWLCLARPRRARRSCLVAVWRDAWPPSLPARPSGIPTARGASPQVFVFLYIPSLRSLCSFVLRPPRRAHPCPRHRRGALSGRSVIPRLRILAKRRKLNIDFLYIKKSCKNMLAVNFCFQYHPCSCVKLANGIRENAHRAVGLDVPGPVLRPCMGSRVGALFFILKEL